MTRSRQEDGKDDHREHARGNLEAIEEINLRNESNRIVFGNSRNITLYALLEFVRLKYEND